MGISLFPSRIAQADGSAHLSALGKEVMQCHISVDTNVSNVGLAIARGYLV
jgi:hypothetical protein